jgi:hypothetical protein
MRSFWLSRSRNPRSLRLEVLEDRYAPATLTVNSAADTASPSDPYLSLREAVAIFNSPSLPGGLSSQILAHISGPLHGGGTDSLSFDHSMVTTPITLTGGQLVLSLAHGTASVTIDGGNGMTVDGNNASRILQVDAGVQATLSNLTLIHGKLTGVGVAGAGIDNAGTLTVSSSTISSNSALNGGNGAGIDNTGTLTVIGSTLASNSSASDNSSPGNGGHGAAIYNGAGGSLTVTNSTLQQNQAASGSRGASSGGGIYNSANATSTVIGSTFTANAASSGGSGGGILNAGNLTVTGSTFDSNSSSANGTFSYGGFGAGIANTGTLTITNSTLSGNHANGSRYGGGNGGGLYNTGSITLDGCTVSGNSGGFAGGGLTNFGTGTVSHSTFNSNHTSGSNFAGSSGGGIYNGGTLTVTTSTFQGNAAQPAYHLARGGALSNSGNLTVTNSTLIGNSAASFEGTSYGGGIDSNGGTLTVTNCTLSANTSSTYGGGISHSGGTVTVNDATLSGNSAGQGGGIYRVSSAGTLTLQNTIVAGNHSDASANSGPDLNGAVNGVSGYNLVGIGDTSLTGISNGTNQNQIGTTANPINAQLAPLGNYGGPTQTMALLSSSPARNAGNPVGAPRTDQRGLPRVVAGQMDIGAFQTQASPVLVTTLQDPGGLLGLVSLREAVNLANASPGGVAISFDPGLANGTVTLGAGELLLTQDVTITGPSGGPVTVSGNNLYRVFEIAAGVSASLSWLTVANGRVLGTTLAQGGGILDAGTLTLTDCTISNNLAAARFTGTGSELVYSQGGGIFNSGGLTLVRCTVSGNSTTMLAGSVYAGHDNGGGLYSNGGVVSLTDCTVSGNSVDASLTGGDGVVYGYGGGLTSDFGTLTMTGCTVAGNAVTGGNGAGYGGGVHSYMSTVTLFNCTIANNTASSSGDSGLGGGVSGLDTSMSLTSCTITGNLASSAASTGSGGGLYYDSSVGSAQLLNTIVAGNSSATDSPDASGSFVSLGFNLVGITDGSAGWGANDLTGTAVNPLDPGLGTLSDNGGPTWTVPLLASSPALGAGDPGQAGSTDQRGVTRGSSVDIGAFQSSMAGPRNSGGRTIHSSSTTPADLFGW